MPGLFQNFIAGRQAGQAEQDRGREIEQQGLQNQLLQRRQQMAEQEFAQHQDTYNREQQFNALAAKYLGGDTVQTLGVPTTGGPPAQAVDESQGPPQYPQPAPATQGGGPQPISQLIGLDPARALELEKVRTARVQQQQQKIYSLATSILNSPKPAATLKYVLGADMIGGDLNIKQFREGLQQQGIEVDKLDDQQATSILEAVVARSRAAAGILPEADFSLGPDTTRFTGDGRVIARGAPSSTGSTAKDKTFVRANTLRDEYSKQTAKYEDIASSYSGILAATRDPSIAGDVALTFYYMKMLDPTSTVARGEQAEVGNAGNVPERIRSLYNSLILGESKLDPNIRADFVNQAKNRYQSGRELYQKKRANYTKLAQRAEVDPVDVIGDDIEIDPAASSPKRDYSKTSDGDLKKELGL
jgi:hypothetical protein